MEFKLDDNGEYKIPGRMAEHLRGMVTGEKGMPPQARVCLPEAADWLTDLYAATDKPDELKKWRAERAKYPFVAPPPRPKP